MHLIVDEKLRWRAREHGADPHLYLPRIDWAKFTARNIIGDY